MSDPVLTGAALPPAVVAVGHFIEWAISRQWVVLIVVPGLSTAGAFLLRLFARQQRRLEPADWVWGFDLGVTACLTVMVSGLVAANSATDSLERRLNYIIGLFCLLGFFVVLLCLGAAAMHKSGWNKSESTPPQLEGRVFWGINGLGVVLLIMAFVIIGGTFS